MGALALGAGNSTLGGTTPKSGERHLQVVDKAPLQKTRNYLKRQKKEKRKKASMQN